MEGLELLGEGCFNCNEMLEILDRDKGYIGCPKCLYYIDIGGEVFEIFNLNTGNFDLRKLSKGIKEKRKKEKERRAKIMICQRCFEQFSEEDFEGFSEEEWESLEQVWFNGEEYCPECWEEMKDWSGDYSNLHPNESDEEFWDHE